MNYILLIHGGYLNLKYKILKIDIIKYFNKNKDIVILYPYS